MKEGSIESHYMAEKSFFLWAIPSALSMSTPGHMLDK